MMSMDRELRALLAAADLPQQVVAILGRAIQVSQEISGTPPTMCVTCALVTAVRLVEEKSRKFALEVETSAQWGADGCVMPTLVYTYDGGWVVFQEEVEAVAVRVGVRLLPPA